MNTCKQARLIFVVAACWLLVLAAGPTLASSVYLGDFNLRYQTGGTVLNSCTLCHTGVPTLNGYGNDFATNYNFADIESLDSDGDGVTNLVEIGARTFPGDKTSFPAAQPTCTDADGDGYALEGGGCGPRDCSDANAQVYPGAVELCTDGIDNDCNGKIDTTDPQAVNCPLVCTDRDGDGYALEGGACGPVDCNDNSAAANPGAAENCTDLLDNDCDGRIDAADPDAVGCLSAPPAGPVCTDNDSDGFALEGGACGPIDCDDADSARNPRSIELCTDGVDNNCDGLVDRADPTSPDCPVGCTDQDLDGYSDGGGACGPVDCNDQNADISPGAAENCRDGIDNDCNGLADAADRSCIAVLPAPVMTLTVAGPRVRLDWAKIPGATGYLLNYAPYPYAGEPVGTYNLGDVTSFSAELPAGAAYYVAITAYNATGSSTYSNIEFFVVKNSVPLAPKLSVEVDGEHVTVSWHQVAGVTGYTLYFAPYAERLPQIMSAVEVGNVTSYSAELWEGADFYVAVKANGPHGSSPYSNYGHVFVKADDDDDDPPAPPVVETGKGLYDGKCAGCHAVNGYDASGSPDLAGKGGLVAGRFAGSHNGQTLTAAQKSLMATFLNGFSAPATGGGSCTSCHGQPPSGNSSPNRAGAHAVHAALNGVGNVCAACHTGASHNAKIDLGFAPAWNARSGAASGNGGSCSNIRCHGGVATPNWLNGSINVDTQCTSCHTAGTSQYNGYASGEHKKHVQDKRIACTQCHDTNRLRNGHFSNLSTAAFEQAPASTIKSSLGYTGGKCLTAGCHGSETWRDDD